VQVQVRAEHEEEENAENNGEPEEPFWTDSRARHVVVKVTEFFNL
jgi:hypothetical protein